MKGINIELKMELDTIQNRKDRLDNIATLSRSKVDTQEHKGASDIIKAHELKIVNIHRKLKEIEELLNEL